MPPSSMDDLFSFLTQLMTQHASLFESMGVNMFRSFATILIVWFGVKTALGSVDGGHGPGFRFDHFAALLLTIAFGFGMVTFYSHPIPGFGVSFYHLIIDQGLSLAAQGFSKTFAHSFSRHSQAIGFEKGFGSTILSKTAPVPAGQGVRAWAGTLLAKCLASRAGRGRCRPRAPLAINCRPPRRPRRNRHDLYAQTAEACEGAHRGQTRRACGPET